MRADQVEKLQALSEKLADAVLIDADPEKWIGYGKTASQMTKEERGDAYWCRKVAAATMSVLKRAENLIEVVLYPGAGPSAEPLDDSSLDAEIASAEKEATHLLDKLARRTKKGEFDKHVHGKP